VPGSSDDYAILWRTLVEASPNIVLVTDPEGKILFFNRMGPIADGAPLVGSNIALFASDGGARIATTLKRTVEARETVRYQVDGYVAHGRRGWHEVCAMPVVVDDAVPQVLWLITDITAQVQDAESLTFQAAILAQVNEAVVATDPPGKITYWNDAAERLYGWTRAEAVGKNSEDLLHPEWPGPETREQMIAALRASGAWVGTMIQATKNGERITSEASIRLLRDGRGTVGSIAVIQDVTARRRLEEQLRQSQKMEAVGLLAGGIAHDFNNLLAIILGYAELAINRLPAEHPVAEDVEEMTQAARRGAELTRKLLAFSRKQILQAKMLDVGAAVGDFTRLLTRVFGEDVELVVEPPSRPLVARADAVQLEQVLLNLCTNARQAMPDGGQLRLATRAVSFDARAVVRQPWARVGTFVEITVTDTGIGMDEATRSRMFEPFFTTKRDGTGLGLATVYGIVQQHGGFVSVESSPGTGTRFGVYLPLTADEASAARANGRPSMAAPGGRESILVAEDETPLRTLLTTTLSDLGYTVIAARDGDEAVRAYEQRSHEVALVVLDVVMPRVDARAAYQRMREVRPDVKVLFMTGYAPESTRLGELLGHGHTRVLEKPFTPHALAAAVRSALDE
jgi:PAS domain S-box-containing protein